MEEKIVYFEKPGKENTAEVIKLVLERAKSRNINKIIIRQNTWRVTWLITQKQLT